MGFPTSQFFFLFSVFSARFCSSFSPPTPIFSSSFRSSFPSLQTTMQPSSTSSSRSSPSLPTLLISTFFLLLLTSTTSFALPHPYPLHQLSARGPRTHFYNSSSSFVASRVGRHSPRPTPEPVAGNFERQKVSYARRHPKKTHLDVGMAVRRAACYGKSTTVQDINDFFTEGGVGATLLLCPGAVISVDETILFAASGQTIQTQGGSTVALKRRATLKITGASVATAIEATGCIK